ncbi:chemotaxis protein CheW [Gorillibacterium sp. sgz5001074]|uniref:chemotaxis protein CheW n=1 Tax=Gorillibacterium sp. sgz5001074 TaxID=3446695 RepID=UPI003F673487
MHQVLHDSLQYIEIGCGTERFAIPLPAIREIIRMQEITELNGCERPCVKGVINLRGKIVPVFSMAERLALHEQPCSKSTRIVLVHYTEETVGVLVDRVHRVLQIGEIQPPPSRTGSGAAVLTGVGQTETGLVSIIDMEKLLHDGSVKGGGNVDV